MDYINSINLYSNTDFPYLVLDVKNDQISPRNPGFQVMHWHEDLQFIYVLDGMIEVKTLDSVYQISAGDGIFINKNVVHLVLKKGTCHYNSFIFPDYFLKFYFGSPAKDCVESIVGKEQLPIFILSSNISWNCEALSILHSMSELEQKKTEYYAYEVLVFLSTLWLKISKNIQLPSDKQETVINLRMQKFLQYIEKHYGEEISLEELAGSANVSKSECLRCFKASLQTTPYKYLTEYRLSRAAEFLKKTDEPISNIASSVGFHQASHFGKFFKEKTGLSPREYRATNK